MEINGIVLTIALLRYMHSDFLKRTFFFFTFLFSHLFYTLSYIRTFVNVTVVSLNSISPLALELFHPEISLHMEFSLWMRDYCLAHSFVPYAILVTI